MWRAALMNIHAQVRVALDQRASHAGVVEVDVCQENRMQVGRRQPVCGQPSFHAGECAGGAWVYQRRLIAEQQVGADHVRLVKMQRIDQTHIGWQGRGGRSYSYALRIFRCISLHHTIDNGAECQETAQLLVDIVDIVWLGYASLPFVGSFFARPGEKRTHKSRNVACCRRLQS